MLRGQTDRQTDRAGGHRQWGVGGGEGGVQSQNPPPTPYQHHDLGLGCSEGSRAGGGGGMQWGWEAPGGLRGGGRYGLCAGLCLGCKHGRGPATVTRSCCVATNNQHSTGGLELVGGGGIGTWGGGALGAWGNGANPPVPPMDCCALHLCIGKGGRVNVSP